MKSIDCTRIASPVKRKLIHAQSARRAGDFKLEFMFINFAMRHLICPWEGETRGICIPLLPGCCPKKFAKISHEIMLDQLFRKFC